jgi:hypothetical protein
MPDATPEEEKDSQDAPLDTVTSSKPIESESQGSITVEGGRRRGRRRVMKKKKVKDEDGYLGKLTCSISLELVSHTAQSQEKRRSLSRSRKMSQSPRKQSLRPSRQTRRKVKRPVAKVKAASPASSRKHDDYRCTNILARLKQQLIQSDVSENSGSIFLRPMYVQHPSMLLIFD